MEKIELFDIFINGISGSWRHQLCHGLLLIAFGVLIIVFPQLLVAMIASVFILTGAILVSASLGARRSQMRYKRFRPGIFELF